MASSGLAFAHCGALSPSTYRLAGAQESPKPELSRMAALIEFAPACAHCWSHFRTENRFPLSLKML